VALTRNNIAYNLHESPYRLEVPYEDQNLTFVFSSNLYKNNFYNRFLDNREKVSEQLTRRFGFPVQHDLLSDLKLYTSIEKRGFLIFDGEGQEFVWQKENITLDGAKLTRKNCGEL
jgi:hypothetical protein